MIDNPEEGPSVASMRRMKLRHNRRSLLSTSVGTGTRAIRNLESGKEMHVHIKVIRSNSRCAWVRQKSRFNEAKLKTKK